MKICTLGLLLCLSLTFLPDHVSCVFKNSQISIKPSKRIEIPHPLLNNPNLYVDAGKSYRRQEVIHALNDDSTKATDDEEDIESLGKSIDSTGAIIKDSIPQVHEKKEKGSMKGTTKDIIAKIKEIQDKLFKRTGNKDLESKLKQMSEMFPLPKEPITKVNTASLKNNTVGDAIDSKSKLTDGSKTPDRRKIIPEDVVDKILEKFQQLRQEAKHMALLESKHEAEKDSNTLKQVSASITEHKERPFNPYESIGPAKANFELKNRTEHNGDVAPFGIDAKVDMQSQSPPETTISEPNSNNIEIPIGNAMNNIASQNSVKGPNQMPVMFIKNGQMLVPVFGSNIQQNSQTPMSVTGTGMAQLNSNPGIAMPNMPNNIVPITNPQQLMSAFMSVLPNLYNNGGGNSMPFVNQMQRTNPIEATFNLPSTAPYIPARNQLQDPISRCGIPGSDCPTPTQSMQSFSQEGFTSNSQELSPSPQDFYSKTKEYSSNPTENIQTFNSNGSPSTMDLIHNILNAPGFPQLAARLMYEPRSYQQNMNREPETGETRGLNNILPSFPMGFRQNDEELNEGTAQFNLQSPYNQAPRSDPGSVYSQPTNPQGPLMSNPHEDASFLHDDSRRDQDEGESRMFGSRNVAMNDISDPDPGYQQQQQPQTPDQLLDMTHEGVGEQSRYRPDGFNEYRESNAFLPTRMSIQRGGTERTLLSGVDPGSLLDKLHGAQLKGGLLGPGDPQVFNPTKSFAQMSNDPPASSFGGTPDDLLEMLRNQNDKVFNKAFAMNDAKRMRNLQHRYTNGLDPSFADDIQDNPFGEQSMDVQSKDVAENNGDGQFVSRHKLPRHHNNDISVLNDDFVQYKHGRMSMDSANIVNSFFKDPQFYRNKISHPHDLLQNNTSLKRSKKTTEKPIVRASITKSLPEDHIELQINGKKLTDKQTLRSKIVNGKYVQPKGKTFSSKGPIQIELSHGQDKRKIINILTKAKYNVTDDRKRTSISRVNLVSD